MSLCGGRQNVFECLMILRETALSDTSPLIDDVIAYISILKFSKAQMKRVECVRGLAESQNKISTAKQLAHCR